MTDTDLIVIPKETALTVFSSDTGLEPFMQKIRAEIDAFVPDISNKRGRDAVASIAHKVAKSKTYLDGVGKDLVAELKELPKKIDASRKTMRDTLDAWKDEVRLPLTEWEEKEQRRIDYLKSIIQHIVDCSNGLIGGQPQPFAILLRELEEKVVIDASFGEFETEALHARESALTKIKTAWAAQQQRDREQAELERLRAEADARAKKDHEDRIAKEAAERAKREAEETAARQAADVAAKAQAEREAEAQRAAQLKADTERRELEQRLALERAEREKADALLAAERTQKDAERRAQEAVEAEQKRVAEALRQEAAFTAAREKDKAHKSAINRAALNGFIAGGMTQECAKLAVTLIAKKQIPHVAIGY